MLFSSGFAIERTAGPFAIPLGPGHPAAGSPQLGLRGLVRRRACTSRAGSPPDRCAARTVRRRSSRSPDRRDGRVSRLRRSGVVTRSRFAWESQTLS